MRFRRLVFSLMFLLVPSGSVVSVPIPVEITRDVPLDNLISLFHKSPSSQASDEHDLFLEEESLNVSFNLRYYKLHNGRDFCLQSANN